MVFMIMTVSKFVSVDEALVCWALCGVTGYFKFAPWRRFAIKYWLIASQMLNKILFLFYLFFYIYLILNRLIMSRYIKAADALCEVFKDEEAGEISEDEEGDELEYPDELIGENSDDVTTDNLNVLNKNEEMLKDNSYILASSSSSMSVDSDCFKKPTVIPKSDSFMSVSSEKFILDPVIKKTSIATVKAIPTNMFFSKPVESTNSVSMNSLSPNIDFKTPDTKIIKNKKNVSNVAKNLFKKANNSAKSAKKQLKKSVNIVKKNSIKTAKESLESSSRTGEFEDFASDFPFDSSENLDVIYGKVTKAMEKDNIQGYKWYLKPNENSYKALDNFNLESFLKNPVSNSEDIDDFFNHFLNNDMVEKIVSYTNIKMNLNDIEKAKRKGIVFISDAFLALDSWWLFNIILH